MSFRCCMSAFQRKCALALKGMSDISCHIYSEDTLEHSSETKVALPMAKNICKTIFSAFILWYFIAGEMICVYLHARKEANIPVAITIVLSNVTATRTCILEFEQKDSTTTATPELPLSREINGGNLDGSGKKCDSQGRAIPQIFLNDDKHK